MTMRNNAAITRGRPFAKGNPGRPKGARHRSTLAAEALLDDEAEALTRKAIEFALEGDNIALRLCLDRIIPVRRQRPTNFALPPLKGAADATAAMASIVDGVAAGDLTSTEASELANLVEAYISTLEADKFDTRLKAVEERGNATCA